MKKYILSLATLAMVSTSFVLTSCGGDDSPSPTPVNPVDPEKKNVINEDITKDTTWKTGEVYVLGKRVKVKNGATLTIEPGVIVKGEAGTGENASALIITRGSKIMAAGTAEKPIIFTTVADEIKPGQVVSPNMGNDQGGFWGGLIILGKAKISAKNKDKQDIYQTNIEGIPASDEDALYGGDNDADSSGVLKYVSIRHGGSIIGEGNEINGLTLGGVGSGTVIENIEIVANADDGVEWFGGAVNMKNLLVWNNADDAIDTDQAWSGTLDGFYVISPSGSALELDGGEGSMNRGHVIKNGKVVITGAKDNTIDTDDNTMVTLENIFFTGFDSKNKQTISHDNEMATYSNIVLDVDASKLNDYFKGEVMPQGVSAGTQAVTPIDLGAFSWTWASKAGKVK